MKAFRGIRLAILWLVSAACLAGAPVSLAQQQDNNADTRINKAQAAQKAKQQVNGRVLKVDQKPDQYRVKMLKKSGRVVSVDVDKRSGQVKPTKGKDSKR